VSAQLLLASTSVAALLIGSGVPAALATGSCSTQNGGTVAAVTNPGAISCIYIFNNATVTGGVTNTGTGVITATGSTAPTRTGITIDNASVGGAIVNAGHITATTLGNGISVVNNAAVTGGISNSGMISAGGYGIDVLNIANTIGGISNSGTISANHTGIVVNSSRTLSGGITNSGTISAGAGISVTQAVSFGTSAGAAISNSGSISAGGDDIYVGHVTNVFGGIANSGTISSGSHAVYVGFVSTFSGGISNSGVLLSATFGIYVANIGAFAGGISNSGSISVANGDAIQIFAVSEFAGGIRNSGTISTANTGIFVGGFAVTGSSLNISNFSGGISNSGRIAASTGSGIWVGGNATNGSTVTVSNFSGGISNSGTISVRAPGLISAGILVGGGALAGGAVTTSTFAGGITNSGTIAVGAGGLVGAGILVGGAAFVGGTLTISAFSGGIANFGTISASGGSPFAGNGIWVGGVAAGGAVVISTFAGGISNAGIITARNAGIFAGGSATAGSFTLITFAGGITNSGTISARRTGIVIEGVSTFLGNVSNSGTILARNTGIFICNCATLAGGAIVNSGTISGGEGIVVHNFSSIGIFDSGTIIGTLGPAIDLTQASGGNTLTLAPGYSITGNVLGYGNDTFQLGGSGSGAFNLSNIGTQYTGFTTFNVVGGTWTVTGATAQNWTIMPAGTLLIGSNTTTIGPNLTDNGAFGFAQTGAYTYSNVISGTGLVEQVGPGTTTLSGVNSYSGGTVIDAGTLAVSADNNLGNAVGGLTFGGGTLQFLSAFATGRPITLNAGGGTIDTNGNNDTLAGNISGTGGLTKIGAGILTLSGSSNYSGPTDVDAGTLLAGAATVFSPASTYTIAAGATLDFGNFNQTLGELSGGGNVTLGSATLTVGGNNTDATFSGTISGTGGLTKAGTGTLALTGTESYSGATAVNNGTLEVDGTITGTSGVTVNAGGTLSGTGIVDPLTTAIMSGAMLRPGNAANPTGTLTIAGNLAFQSGALYVVQVTPAAAASVTVAGTATLGGTVNAVFSTGAYLWKHYTILTATGGLGGTTFAGLTNTNLPAGMSDDLSYNTNNVYLNLTTQYTSLNANQQAVANALTNYFNTTGGIPARFAGVSPAGLSQLDGEAATGGEQSVFHLTSEFLNLMLDPFVNGRGYGPGVSGSAGGGSLGFAPGEQTSVPSDFAPAYAAILGKAPAPSFDQRWSAWGAAFGGSNTTGGDPTVGSHDITAGAYGFAAGMDYHVSPSTIVGFALAGAGTNWGLSNGLGGGYSNAVQVGTYGITWFGPAYLAGALSFANHWFTTSRSALGDQLTANFAGQSYGARFEGGYRVSVWRTFGVTPYGALQAQDFQTPSYSESDVTGGGFGLSYNPMNATDVRTELGARFDDPTLVYGKPLILFGRLAWAHDFVSNPTLSAVFEALPGSSFTVNGAPIPQNSALATAGAQYFLAANWSVIAKFDGEFASGSQTYGGSGTLRYMW
jgi:autotransporter-associated beta strand protein